MDMDASGRGASPSSCYLFIFVRYVPLRMVFVKEPEKSKRCANSRAIRPAYNHKLIEISGFVSHAFEDFSVSDPSCSSWPGIWLEYGGSSKSGTMYCCGETANRDRPSELVIDKITIPLLKNQQFQQFISYPAAISFRTTWRSHPRHVNWKIFCGQAGRVFQGQTVGWLRTLWLLHSVCDTGNQVSGY